MLREPTAGSGKPRRGHEKHCPAARIEAAKKTSAGGTKPGPPARTERKWKCSEAPFMVLQAAQLHLQLQEAVLLPAASGATSCGQHVGLRARVVVLEGHERAHQSELGFEQQNRFRNLREIWRIEKKAFGARAEPSPGPPASETDAGPPGHQPRGGAPARPRLSRGQEGPAQKARKFSAWQNSRFWPRSKFSERKICPKLGFEQRNRFRNSRGTQKAFRARAGCAKRARQGGTEPGTTRFRRKTTGPPAPRRGPAAPAVQPRQRGLDLESAQVQRVAEFAILAPNLDLNNETDLEACGTRAELKRKS